MTTEATAETFDFLRFMSFIAETPGRALRPESSLIAEY